LRLLARSGQNKAMFPRVSKKNILCRVALVFAVAIAGNFPATAAQNYFTRT
jgi:hypothetical protein